MLKRIFIGICVPLFAYSCANIAPLEGGPKDTTPPQVTKALPENGSTHFKGGRIRLQFDEYIVIKNQQKEIVVTPPIAAFPEIKPNVKHVDVNIADSLLKPNTTYTINFGGSITDNNEGNVLQNYTYVFSTGDKIDSQFVKANIVDAKTLKPIKEAKLQLYDQLEDSTVYKETPFYVGSANDLGVAQIDYMREGSFKAIALVEDATNYLYNQGDDYIGFLDQEINTSDTIIPTIYVFKEPTKQLKLRSAKGAQKGAISFKFNGSAENVSIKVLNDSLPLFENSSEIANEEKDSLIYWYPQQAPDTLFFQISYPDGRIDTNRAVAKLVKTASSGSQNKTIGRGSRGSNDQSAPNNNSSVSNINKGFTFKHNLATAIDYFDTIQLAFAQPVKTILDSAIYIKDGDKIIYPEIKMKDDIRRNALIIYPLLENKTYELHVKDSAFISIWNQTNDSMHVSFKTTLKLDYTSLILNISNMEYRGNVIFTLLDQNNKEIKTKQVIFSKPDETVIFELLKAGNYRVRLTYDANGNGVWDSGNFAQRIQPEKVTFFPTTIDIKRGFEAEIDWNISGE